MKKKLLLITFISITVVMLVGSILVISNITKEEKSKNKNQEIKELEKKESVKENEDSIINNEENNIDNSSNSSESLDSNIDDISSKKQTSSTSNDKPIIDSNKKQENKDNIKPKENDTESKEIINPVVPSVSKNTDEEEWENFKNDPETKRILGGHISNIKSSAEANAKIQKLSTYGYNARWIDTCVMLSTGKKCLYGVVATISENICESNPKMEYPWWQFEQYVDIITYLKSQGYPCAGKSW